MLMKIYSKNLMNRWKKIKKVLEKLMKNGKMNKKILKNK